MNDRSPHSWPDCDSVTARDPEPTRPEGPDCDDTVIVWDPQSSRLPLMRQIVEDSNLRLRRVQDLASLEDERHWKASSIAVVALGARPSPGDVALEVIRTLKQRGLTVISYEAGPRTSWHCPRARLTSFSIRGDISGNNGVVQWLILRFLHQVPTIQTQTYFDILAEDSIQATAAPHVFDTNYGFSADASKLIVDNGRYYYALLVHTGLRPDGYLASIHGVSIMYDYFGLAGPPTHEH